jgi:hypothetical protein
MPLQTRDFELRRLLFFITRSHRYTRLFHRDGSRRDFIQVLGQLRQEAGSLLIDSVLTRGPCYLLGKRALARTA